jgi:dihydroorotase
MVLSDLVAVLHKWLCRREMDLTVPSPADFHVHLRQGPISELVTPHVREGGFNLAYVMVIFLLQSLVTVVLTPSQPNLQPPITTTNQALAYKAELEKIDPHVQYLMALYLSPGLTPDEIRKAKKAGVAGQSPLSSHTAYMALDLFTGVKSYPRGVTTNSDGGIESYETYYPVFEAMQDVDMVLNLHGEVPSDPSAVGPDT